MLARWGRLVYRRRWLVLIASALSLLVALPVILTRPALDPPDVPADTESGRALRRIAQDLAARPPSFTLIFSSAMLSARNPAFRGEVERALAPLARDGRVARVRTAYDGVPGGISRDGRRALAVVELHGRAAGFASLEFSGVSPEIYPALRTLVRSETLEVLAAGPVALNHDFTEVARTDVGRVEVVILPLVAVLLLLVFGSVVAATLPLAVGGLAMAWAIAGTFLLARVGSVSIYAPNIVSMIGLGVAIDYSLFVVSRFREELHEQPAPEALARTVATAGRAILFSGLTVAIGLLGLTFLGLGNLASLGWAGTLVVAFALLHGLTTLPALLAVLGPRVNVLRLPLLDRARPRAGRGLWHWLASTVMAHPWRVLLPVVALLLVLGQPLLHLRVGAGDETALPPEAESRRAADLLRREFPSEDVKGILVVLDAGRQSPLTPERVAQAHALSRWIARLPHVVRVDSFVDLDPSLDLPTYQFLAALPREQRPPQLAAVLPQLVGEHVLLLAVSADVRPSSDEARALVREIRRAHPPFDGEVLVAGQTAFDLDFIGLTVRRAPLAVGLIVLVTFLVMLWLLDSVVLPLKAIVMNLLSITASFGAYMLE